MKVFLDTNIILDFLLKREPFINEVDNIFKMKDEKDIEFFISSLSVANIAYIIDKLNKKPHTYISSLLFWFSVLPLTKESIEQAAVSKFDDFEDGLQYFIAKSFGSIDAIITRNRGDFKTSIIPVFTPTEFSKEFEQ